MSEHTPEQIKEALDFLVSRTYPFKVGSKSRNSERQEKAFQIISQSIAEIAVLRAQVEEWELIKKAFVEEYNAKNKGWNRNPLDYHSHGHDVAGIWDSDNGVLAGKKCAACMAMRAALAATGKE